MGIAIGVLIILLWAGHLFYALSYVSVDPSSPWLYFHILLQAYLYTGLFITGHNFVRTQRRNHLWAMLSCYFFGYHYEHHEIPSTPWWKLYKTKGNI